MHLIYYSEISDSLSLLSFFFFFFILALKVKIPLMTEAAINTAIRKIINTALDVFTFTADTAVNEFKTMYCIKTLLFI